MLVINDKLVTVSPYFHFVYRNLYFCSSRTSSLFDFLQNKNVINLNLLERYKFELLSVINSNKTSLLNKT